MHRAARATVKAARSRLDVHAASRVHSYTFTRSRHGIKMNVTVRASARKITVT
jgi:hypothetical protein